MPFLEGLLISTRNLISDYGRRDQDEASTSHPNRNMAPIHEGLEQETKEEETATPPRTVEQLEAAITRTKAKFQEVKAVGRQATNDHRLEIKTLKSEMQQWDTKLKKRQRTAYDVPYDEYSQYMLRPETAPLDNNLEGAESSLAKGGQAKRTSTSTSNADPNGAAAGPTVMERRLCRVLEAQLLKHMHLLMVAEQQLQIQSSIWNDIVLDMHEKPTSLDQNFIDTKVVLLQEISTTEKTNKQLEQEGETKVRKQVLSMCKLKRTVAQEVKKKTSMLEDQVFRKTDDNTQQLLRTLSNDTFNSADLSPLEGETKTASPEIIKPSVPLLRQSSSLKLRLAREKAAARLAESKMRFNNSSGNMSLDSIDEDIKIQQEDQRLSPSGVNEFPIIESS